MHSAQYIAIPKQEDDALAHAKKSLSSLVKCYNPVGTTSQERYAWTAQHLSNVVEEAIQIRNASS